MDSSNKIVKYFLGFSFVIGSLSYIYYTYFSKDKNEKYLNEYIDKYLESLKSYISQFSNELWKYNTNLLCHLNFIINEILSKVKEIEYPLLDKNRIKIFENEKEWKEQIKKDNEQMNFIKNEIITKLIPKILNIETKDIIPILNDKLILLKENEKFCKLIPYEENIINSIIEKIDEQKIEDSFFFASVKQIELNKLVEQKFSNIENLNNLSEIEDFKNKFKDEFIYRYGFNCKFLPEIMIKKNGDKGVSFNLLINKIIY